MRASRSFVVGFALSAGLALVAMPAPIVGQEGPGLPSKVGDTVTAQPKDGGKADAKVVGCGGPSIKRPTSQRAVGHAWSMAVEVSDNDGVVLRDVKLGERYMAQKISVPYFTLRTRGMPPGRCELKPDGQDASCRSRLIDFKAPAVDDQRMTFEASFAIDRIPEGSSNCVVVTQRYEFRREADQVRLHDHCEPLGRARCARFFPTIESLFLPDRKRQQDEREAFLISFAQRFHFKVDGVVGNRAAIFRDCEAHEIQEGCVKLGEGQFMKSLAGNPLPRETFEVAFEGSQVEPEGPKIPGDIITQRMSGSSYITRWDNFHQTSGKRVEEPDFLPPRRPGCPECVHIHWRWLTQSVIEGGPEFGYGLPLVDSHKAPRPDLTVAVVQYAPGKEEDPESFGLLVSRAHAFGADADPVFWYEGRSRRLRETFFRHGGFFARHFDLLASKKAKLIRGGPGAVVPGSFLTYEFQGAGVVDHVRLGDVRAADAFGGPLEEFEVFVGDDPGRMTSAGKYRVVGPSFESAFSPPRRGRYFSIKFLSGGAAPDNTITVPEIRIMGTVLEQ